MEKRTLAFEIGTEEMPAFALHDATLELEKKAADAFGALFSYDTLAVYSTPRRLIVLATGIPEATEAVTEEFRGPEERIAFDAQGQPTKAATGFARGKGVDVSSLELRDEGGKRYVYAVRHVPEKRVADVLPQVLGGLITGLSWPKTQRWGAHSEQFIRPVRWLLALFGTEVVPLSYAGLQAGNATRGHRFLAPGPHVVESADALLEVLRAAFVVPSEAEREESIRAQIAAYEAQSGLVSDLPAKTMREVVNLAEYPTVMIGEFDPLFLAVPKEITVDAMLVHQRYFPLFNADGSLTNKFIITSNGDAAFAANIIDGNERVVAARLYDAKFFYDEDLKKPLEAYVADLENVVFQEALGTTKAKTLRISQLAAEFATEAGMCAPDVADAKRAAYLCKADLVTGAVVEFTSVQGIMGCYYAKAAGETDQVAAAIADHYRPRFAGDALPQSAVGQVVAFADKLDTICGLFAVGQAPTGSSDPFALRRSAIGIITMLTGGLKVNLEEAIDRSLALYAADGLDFDAAAVRAEVLDFFATRARVMLRDGGAGLDTIDAVAAVGVREPAVLAARVHALDDARKNSPETFDDLATAYARANNLRKAECGQDFQEGLMWPVEQELCSAIAAAEQKVAAALERDDYPAALDCLAALRKPIDAFFEGVMVMDDDVALRENRMKILNRFVAVFAHVADFGAMAKVK